MGGLAAMTVAASILSSGNAPAPAAAGVPSPNIVVIQADDQTLESMRVMKKTNRLIGRNGATFPNTFTNWPLCCPSRATQLTGQYAHNHGVLGNEPPLGGYGAFDREENLAVWLEDAGYQVGHVGKFLNGYGPRVDLPETPQDDKTEVPPGWTEWRTYAGGTFRFYDYLQTEWSAGDGGSRNGALVEYGTKIKDYKTHVTTDDAGDLIRGFADTSEPFYLQVDYSAPHAGGPRADKMPRPPFDCGPAAKAAPQDANAFDHEPLVQTRSPAFDEADVSDKPPEIAALPRLSNSAIGSIKTEYRCRLEALLAVDDGVADIMRRLRRTGELADTYVFFTSDNGYFGGEHRIRRGKGLAYEPAVSVPLLMRGPGVPPGVTVDDLTSNADFATTVLELTGASSGSREPDGKSLIAAAQNPHVETGRELLIETLTFDAIRTQRYKWVEYQDGFRELYDLLVDEDETENVADAPAYAEVRAQLATRLASLRDCSGPDCRLAPEVEVDYEGAPEDDSCIPGDLVVRVSGADVGTLRAVWTSIDGSRVATDTDPPFEYALSRADLQAVDGAELATGAEMIDGRRVVWTDLLDVCP